MKYFKLLRVDNWVKNLIIFLPLFFSSEILDVNKFSNTFFGIIGFSFVTGFVYVINDIFDVDFDKNHPDKKFRPIASGNVSIKNALIIGFVSFLVGLTVLWCCSFEAFLLSVIYFLITLLYSFKLKHISIIDFVIISLVFVIRILVGGELGKIALSQWIIVMVFLASLFLAVSKRRDDVYKYEREDKMNRKVIDKYTVELMDKIITITSSVLIVAYLLFITSEDVILRYPSKYLLVTFIFVLLGIFRYNQLTYVYNKSGSPVNILFSDRFLQIILFCWLLVYFFVIYSKKIIDG